MSDRVGGHVVRNMPDFDGWPVVGNAPDLYVWTQDGYRRVPVWTEPTAIGLTVKTPCPKAVNARRKCALCAAETAA